MMAEELEKELLECFRTAIRDEKIGKKHKGLLIVEPNNEEAKIYIQKAKDSLDLCGIYKEKRYDVKNHGSRTHGMLMP